MAKNHSEHRDNPGDYRLQIRKAIEHLDHLLPGQAPILNFVHHNTLHGYQHLPFTEALAQAEQRTGIRGYLPEAEYRGLYEAGRITDADLEAVLAQEGTSSTLPGISGLADLPASQNDIDHLVLTKGFEALSPAELRWQVEEMGALDWLQPDLPPATRTRLLATQTSITEPQLTRSLWSACAQVLDVPAGTFHPEAISELHRRGSETLAGELSDISKPILADICRINPALHSEVRHAAEELLRASFERLGDGTTLRDLLLSITGTDLLEEIRPLLVRFCASHLDEGLSSWNSPDRSRGLYASWRNTACLDASLEFANLPDWRQTTRTLPEDAEDAIVHNLQRLGIPPNRWCGYLERLALEIPGWSGLINWRQHRPQYQANQNAPSALCDYLAIRLSLDTLFIERLCRTAWDIAGNTRELHRYFRNHLSEFYARHALFNVELPEFLAQSVQQMVGPNRTERRHHAEWRNVADMVHAWHSLPGVASTHSLHGSVWRLFRLAQHLALSPQDILTWSQEKAEGLLRAAANLSPDQRSFVWLRAYERHYRNEVFEALIQNHGRGRWRERALRPQAQLVFCMDDREESIRRHLEELNPSIETLGAAGFFGVPMNWRGLDDEEVTPLCPVVVTPSHEVQERPRDRESPEFSAHVWGLQIRDVIRRGLHRELRRNLISSQLLINLLAPLLTLLLALRLISPHLQKRWIKFAEGKLIPEVPTSLVLTAAADSAPASPSAPRLGFTDTEQAERVAGFLRIIGLTGGFAPLVVIVGHGSGSENNPHLAAYDCGACSGRHGGPNARTFAAMANRPEIRQLVGERGIQIPEDSWFLGAEHNTCNEDLLWFDTDLMPPSFNERLSRLQKDLQQALHLSAHERCRRLASAPRQPSFSEAMKHMLGRAADISQARPELGHATNAAALIGRRSVTQGTFLDRRVFLISYDSTIDPDGKILEGILLAAGPVGAGINLEYYFSTVNNDRFGCGTKVPHNVTGLFGIMEGSSSDLRTGLPRQMIEIHEAMRLQVIVEARTEVLAEIYSRQPPLRELIGNGWILLSAIDPDSGAVSVFEPGQGFLRWTSSVGPLPQVARSADWYQGHSQPLSPALIVQPPLTEMAHAL